MRSKTLWPKIMLVATTVMFWTTSRDVAGDGQLDDGSVLDDVQLGYDSNGAKDDTVEEDAGEDDGDVAGDGQLDDSSVVDNVQLGDDSNGAKDDNIEDNNVDDGDVGDELRLGNGDKHRDPCCKYDWAVVTVTHPMILRARGGTLLLPAFVNFSL